MILILVPLVVLIIAGTTIATDSYAARIARDVRAAEVAE